MLAEGDGFPNGLAFADERTLVVVDSHRHALLRYRVEGEGLVADGTVRGRCRSPARTASRSTPTGRLFVAAFDLDAVLVLAPGGDGRRAHRAARDAADEPLLRRPGAWRRWW